MHLIRLEGQKMTDKKNPDIESTGGEQISLSRRSALLKLGLATVAVYAAPALLTLSEAEAGKRGGSGKNTGKSTGKSRRSRKSKKSRRTRRSPRSRRSRRSS
jgi:hypothetical protein